MSAELRTWLASLEEALSSGDAKGASLLFAPESYWRDMVAFTWNIATFEGPSAIEQMLAATLGATAPRDWRLEGQPQENEGCLECWFSFQTAAGTGRGHVRLRDGKGFTLLTTLASLHEHPWRTGRQRPRGVDHGASKGKQTHTERRAAEAAALGRDAQPYCLIIGGGQGGMALAARLDAIGVPNLIVEKNAEAGDSWRNRYPSLCLHDPVWYDHMPYIPFPDGWPVFTPKDRMADWLEMYAKVMELNYWTKARCEHAAFDPREQRWVVKVNRDGETIALEPAHIVFATGMSGYPNVPELPGNEAFKGEQFHSSLYAGGAPFSGKRCVVLGSNTSAHDICADLWEHGADVTMVQRSGTLVVQTDTVLEHVVGALYSENALEAGMDTETADYTATTWPHRLLERRQVANCEAMRLKDEALHQKLEKAGFILDFGPDKTGLVMKSFREGGGFYINVGASELICDGEIKLRSGLEVERLTENAVVLADGSTLPADVVIYATGYGSMSRFVGDIVGEETADRVGKCWGVGSGTRKDPGPWEGELRNMWKPTAQENLWFQGGNIAQSRHYSRFLALQLKARMEGVPTPVYAAGRSAE
ncbi:MAG: NAD(P)/FAD-dependent oxidoreductase [Pseudomonadota bacterium]